MIHQKSNLKAMSFYTQQKELMIQPEPQAPFSIELSIDKQQGLYSQIAPMEQLETNITKLKVIDENKQSQRFIPNKQRLFDSKFIQSKIRSKFSRMTKINPKISSFMKNICQQIKSQVLNNYKPQNKSKQNEDSNINIAQTHPLLQQICQAPPQIIADADVVKNSCFRKMLVHSHIDNDIPSDEEDLNAGINYMYSELLYSVGSEIVNKRKEEQSLSKQNKIKTSIVAESNKQNYDSNRMQLNSQSQKQNNLKKQKINIPKMRSQIKSKQKPVILSIRL